MKIRREVAIGNGSLYCLVTLKEDDGYLYVFDVEYQGKHKKARSIIDWIDARELAKIARDVQREIGFKRKTERDFDADRNYGFAY